MSLSRFWLISFANKMGRVFSRAGHMVGRDDAGDYELF